MLLISLIPPFLRAFGAGLPSRVWSIEKSFKPWRSFIDELRSTGRPSALEHADLIEGKQDAAPASQDRVRMRFPEDVSLWSIFLASVGLGIPLSTHQG